MGIYDLQWTDDSHFITCSADNNVKFWSLDSDAAEKELTQGDAKRDISRQLVTVRKLHDGRFLAINLSGDLCFWADGQFSSHKAFNNHMQFVCPDKGQNLYISCDKRLFCMSGGEKVHECTVSTKNFIKALVASSSGIFTADLDKTITHFDGEKETAKTTLPQVVNTFACNDSHLFVVTMQDELFTLDCKDLSIKKQQKLNIKV